jgi:class 3 adenylate cyclase
MATPRVDRRLAAILAADVVGYSRLMGDDEAGTLEKLKTHRKELIEPLLAEHRGRIVKLMGDGALCEFGSVVDAVACAIAIQRGMAERETGVAEDQKIRFRIGINTGDVIIEGDDIYGDGVNVAARLEGLAEPGGICVSGRVREEIARKLAVGFTPMGAQRVKNIAEPVEAWRVVSSRAKCPGPPAYACQPAGPLRRSGWRGPRCS